MEDKLITNTEPSDNEKTTISLDEETGQYYGWKKTTNGGYIYGTLTLLQVLKAEVLTLQSFALNSGYNTLLAPQVPYKTGDLLEQPDGIYKAIASKSENETFDINDWKVLLAYNIPVIQNSINEDDLEEGNNWAGIEVLTETKSPVRFWAGATFEDRENAPFRVLENGHVYASNGEFTGIIHATSGVFENVVIKGSFRKPFTYHSDSLNTEHTDNIVLLSNGGGWIDEYNLPWTVEQSGRRVCISTYRWNEYISTGSAAISAPSGKYFFEDGIARNSLSLSREFVELLGYGDSGQFYGWIVLERTNIMTEYKYGRQLNVLAIGLVTGSKTGASLLEADYKTFDGTNMSVTRLGEGRYRLFFSSAWFGNDDNFATKYCIVMLTGVGYSVGSSVAPIKPTLITRSSSYIDVYTSDDSTRNDGSFMFQISSLFDWGTIQTA